MVRLMGQSTSVAVTIEQEVSDQVAESYFELYLETFGHLAERAAARQLLHRDEFMEEMRDHRVHKYVARDADGVIIGMSTLTNHLETVPWISPDYYTRRFPDHAARGAIYYLGFTLVQATRRRSRVFQSMIGMMVELMVAERAVCAWDICAHNDDELSFGANVERMLTRTADVTVVAVDRQTYYAGDFHGWQPVPQQRGPGAVSHDGDQ